MPLNLKKPIAFFDLETTGIQIVHDRIVEISILKVFPHHKTESKTLRINPTIPIPKEASKIHGIYDNDVAHSPTFKEVAKEIYDFISDSDLGGYNSNRFDIPLLVEEFLRVDIDLQVERRKHVDVQVIFHTMEKRTLEAAYAFYCNKSLTNAHSAEADTLATYEVLLSQLDKYPNLKNDLDFLHEFTTQNEWVDVGRRMIYLDGVPCFNFGKYKGTPVIDVLKKDPGYYGWMMRSDFGRHTKLKLKQIKENIDYAK